MAILITGAGLVGSHVGRALQTRGEEVIFYDLAPSREFLATVLDVDRVKLFAGDITDLPALASIVLRHSVSCIVHSAALVGAPVSREPFRGVQVNVGGSVTVIEAARLAQVPRVVFCSSVAIYDFEKLPPGSRITEESPVGPKNLYGATKLTSEHLINQYGNLYQIDVAHMRMAGVFGRGQYRGGSWMGLVLNRALETLLDDGEATLRPEWLGTQEYVYCKDVGEAFARVCLTKENTSGAYNIGTGVLHSCAAVVAEIRRLIPNARIQMPEPETPIVSYLNRTQAFDTSKAELRFGFTPQFSFRSGLQDYLRELQSLRR